MEMEKKYKNTKKMKKGGNAVSCPQVPVIIYTKSTDMYIEMPFSDCISRLICIYREGISLPHNFHENYATCSGNPRSKSIKID
jgi:hypothetical protein